MQPVAVTLARMVDLAVGTPEVGAVNFNVLHSLLHAVLQQLNISDVKADLPEGDESDYRLPSAGGSYIDRAKVSKAENINGRPDQFDTDSDSGLTGLTSASDAGLDHANKSGDVRSGKSIPLTRSPYHSLEEKVERLERQLAQLSTLPSTQELMGQTGGAFMQTNDAGKVPRPVAEMWQSMQLSRKVDANTQGVSKLMSLVDDMMREMQRIKDSNEEMREKLKSATNDNDKFEEIMKKIDDLEKQAQEFRQRLDALPNEEFFNGFVAWSALEDALNGLRQQYENMPRAERAVERLLIETGNQTDLASRPASRYQSRASTPGPSAQLQELLERLGRLHEQHDSLEERVESLEEGLKSKASKEEFEALSSLTNDAAKQIQNLMKELDSLKDGQTKDHTSITELTQMLNQLQSDLDHLNKALQKLYDQAASHLSDIQRLYELTKELDDGKADKDFVLNAVNEKADKEHLDAKVNRNQFDTTCNELNQMINDLINKLLGTEGEWRNALGQLSTEMDSKMDRLEFGPFRDELERQLRALASKLSKLHSDGMQLNDDEAAGIRKQLLQRFHCISCDKPVDMAPHKPQPSIPDQPALPENRSMRPYIVYEIDQIRQYSRQHGGSAFGPGDGTATDLYATARACGGSHTMTFPHRRMTRLQHAREPSYLTKNNVGNGTKLPNVASRSSRSSRHPPGANAQSVQLPPANGTNTSRPQSASTTPRPMSAEPTPHAVQRSMTAAPAGWTRDRKPSSPQQQSTPTRRSPLVTVQLPKLSTGDAAGTDDAAGRPAPTADSQVVVDNGNNPDVIDNGVIDANDQNGTKPNGNDDDVPINVDEDAMQYYPDGSYNDDD